MKNKNNNITINKLTFPFLIKYSFVKLTRLWFYVTFYVVKYYKLHYFIVVCYDATSVTTILFFYSKI